MPDTRAGKPRGGKRVGAGRPKGSGSAEPSKVMRVPVSLVTAVEGLEDMLMSLRAYRDECGDSTSPRADKLKKMFAELRELYPWI
jgi:hypothetical protein